MGLFGMLKKNKPEPEMKLEVRTEKNFRMYVYDGTPLKGLRKGSRFEVTYVARKTKLKSIYTGETTKAPGAFFVGKTAVGCTFSEPLNDRLAALGKSATVPCLMEGWDKKGWPNVRFYLPEA